MGWTLVNLISSHPKGRGLEGAPRAFIHFGCLMLQKKYNYRILLPCRAGWTLNHCKNPLAAVRSA